MDTARVVQAWAAVASAHVLAQASAAAWGEERAMWWVIAMVAVLATVRA